MVRCNLCNKEFKKLTASHLKTHGVSHADYQSRCNNRFYSNQHLARTIILVGKTAMLLTIITTILMSLACLDRKIEEGYTGIRGLLKDSPADSLHPRKGIIIWLDMEGPAAKAGMKPTDRLIELNNCNLDSYDRIRRGTSVGDRLSFTVVRDKAVLKISFTLAPTPFHTISPPLSRTIFIVFAAIIVLHVVYITRYPSYQEVLFALFSVSLMWFLLPQNVMLLHKFGYILKNLGATLHLTFALLFFSHVPIRMKKGMAYVRVLAIICGFLLLSVWCVKHFLYTDSLYNLIFGMNVFAIAASFSSYLFCGIRSVHIYRRYKSVPRYKALYVMLGMLSGVVTAAIAGLLYLGGVFRFGEILSLSGGDLPPLLFLSIIAVPWSLGSCVRITTAESRKESIFKLVVFIAYIYLATMFFGLLQEMLVKLGRKGLVTDPTGLATQYVTFVIIVIIALSYRGFDRMLSKLFD